MGQGMNGRDEWVPPADIDPHIVSLCAALNAFPGIETIGSCGGHADPKPGGWEEGTWYVKFRVRWDDAGRFALEFLAWLINNDYRRAGHHVTMYPTAPPPYLNDPGNVLAFALEGYDGVDAERLARWIDEVRAECYVPPERE